MSRIATEIARLRSIVWPRWVRRLWHPSAVLLIALATLLAEPLLCIIHCQLYIPWLLRHQHVHQHVHTVGASHLLAPAPVLTGNQVAGVASIPAHSGPLCFGIAGSDPFSGMPAPPSPIHDVVPIFGATLLGILLLRRVCLRGPPLLLQILYPPPTPPPRPLQ